MNETLQTLLNRRSIRKYKEEQIKDEELQAVLKAGMYAPSGKGKQSPIFIVVQDKEMLKRLDAMNSAIKGTEIPQYFGAPTVIMVLADKSISTHVEDASVALANMFNAAASIGLGSCWVHRERQMFESEEGKALLKKWGVEGDYVGVGSCTLGYPDGEAQEAPPRKDKYVFYVK